jgi:hypothetical protein
VYQTKQNNVAVNAYHAWMSSTGYFTLPAASWPGYPQWATVQAYCNGLNADSAVTNGANTTKWIKGLNISFTAGLNSWRRVNVNAACPANTSRGNFYLYVGADGWGGARTSAYPIQTDEGYTIAGAGPGGGGNSGWVSMNSDQNLQWINTTANWGYWGDEGWGVNVNGNDMNGTYWNASAWGTWAYYWYGSCSTPYAVVGDKGADWIGAGGIRNLGDPFTRYNAALNRMSLTQAGVDAIA